MGYTRARSASEYFYLPDVITTDWLSVMFSAKGEAESVANKEDQRGDTSREHFWHMASAAQNCLDESMRSDNKK